MVQQQPGEEYQFNQIDDKYERDEIAENINDPFGELLRNVKGETNTTQNRANEPDDFDPNSDLLSMINKVTGTKHEYHNGQIVTAAELEVRKKEEDHFEFSDSMELEEPEGVKTDENKSTESEEVISEGEDNTMDGSIEMEKVQEDDIEGENQDDISFDEIQDQEEEEIEFPEEQEQEEGEGDNDKSEVVDEEFYSDIENEEEEELEEFDGSDLFEDEEIEEEEIDVNEEDDESYEEESGNDESDTIIDNEEIEEEINDDEEYDENNDEEISSDDESNDIIDNEESEENESFDDNEEEEEGYDVNHIEIDIEHSEEAKKYFGDVLFSNASEQLRPYFDNESVNIAEVDDDGRMDLICPICGASVDVKSLTEDDSYDFSKRWFNQHVKINNDYEFEYIDCENCKLAIKRRWAAKQQLANPHLLTSIIYITDALGINVAINDTLDLVPTNKIPNVDKKILQLMYPTDRFICVDNVDQIYVFTYLSLIETFKEIVDELDTKDDWENPWDKYLHWLENDSQGLIAKEFKDKGYGMQLNWLRNEMAVSFENDRFVEEDNNTVYCMHNCSDCPQEFTCDNLNELIEHTFTMNGDSSKCSIFAELKKDSVENLSIENLPPLTEEEIDCIKRHKPKADELEPYIMSYLKVEKYKNLDKKFIKELGVRDWITATLQSEKSKKATENLDKELFGFSDDDDQIIKMDGRSTQREGLDYRNDKSDNWKEDEYSSWINEENRRRKERMEDGRVRAEDMLKGISEDEDDIDPALEDLTLKDSFKKSPFYEMLQYVIGDREKNTAQIQVQCNKNTNYVPIIDTSTGFRFVCIETDDSVVRMYNFNPITLSSNVAFWFREHRNSYRTYALYKCDVKAKKRQIAAAIVKLINYGTSYSPKRICRLMDNYIPVYNTERVICDKFFEQHSLLAFDRFSIESLIVLGIINNDKYKDSYVYKRKEIYRNQIERFSKNKMMSSEGANISGLAGIKYYAVNQTNMQKEVIGRTYIITQYTENANLLLENGLWYCILALMKEHEKIYNSGRRLGSDRIWMEISFEFDRATVPSPIITTMLAEDGCLAEDTRNYVGVDFEVNRDYKGMTLNSTVYAGIIPDPADRRPGLRRDDAIIDIRWFKTEALMKKFFGNEIGPDVRLTTQEEKQSFLKKRGYDDDFTIPEAMRFDVRADTLRELINGDSYRTLEMMSFKNYNQEQVDSILGDHNAAIVRECMGPIWEELAKKAPSDILGNTLKKIGQNLDMNFIKDVISQFRK